MCLFYSFFKNKSLFSTVSSTFFWVALKRAALCAVICSWITCIHVHCNNCIRAIVYLLYHKECLVTLLVYSILYLYEYAQCSVYPMLWCVWTWSVWSLTRDVNTAWECDTPSVPVSMECQVTWPVRPELARNPVSAAVKVLQVLSALAFPHWRALGGMDTLAAYSTNTLPRTGKWGWAPPLSIARGRSSLLSPTMATAITAQQYKPGRGPAKCS